MLAYIDTLIIPHRESAKKKKKRVFTAAPLPLSWCVLFVYDIQANEKKRGAKLQQEGREGKEVSPRINLTY